MIKLDVLFIHPNASKEIYQELSGSYAAIEPPIWAALLAGHCRSRGFGVELMDCEALNMPDNDALYHIRNMKPRLIVFVIYGQQPSASSQNMTGAIRLAERIKHDDPYTSRILFVGGHISALTKETLDKYPFVDFACQNEGAYTISDLLNTNLIGYLDKVPGLTWRQNVDETKQIVTNPPAQIVPKEKLHIDLPGMAWDLLPMKHYRTALWHALPNKAQRQPFASLYTSLGCPFQCTFCCINAPFGTKQFRFWDPEFILQEFDKIAHFGITNIKIADEMFVLNENHFLNLCNLIIERKYKFNIWAYARVDTVKDKYLETLKKAGVNFLALGIESGNKSVRKDVIKGRFEDVNIKSVVEAVHNHGIEVMGNYIFGLPEDNIQTMQETLDMAMELNTAGANFYSAMAYPGSQLYTQAKEQGWKLPESYEGFSQHSYECQPLPTKYLSAEEVLRFRDNAWLKYHTNPKYLDMVLKKFGNEAYNETINSTKINLKRRILGD